MTEEPNPPRLGPLAALIFSSRWLQLPLYLGLIVAQGVYVVLFIKELSHLITGAFKLTEQAMMLIVLALIDVVMISNLLMMVIVGGYETFVSRLRLHNHPDQPEWLSHVNASVLKVKLAMAIIGISSVHLLKTFIAAGKHWLACGCGSRESSRGGPGDDGHGGGRDVADDHPCGVHFVCHRHRMDGPHHAFPICREGRGVSVLAPLPYQCF